MNETSIPLWILWKKPSIKISKNNAVLSFLSPIDEIEFIESKFNKIFIGRSILQSSNIRSKALQIYNQIIAEIGITPLKQSQTLRKSLLIKNTTSTWWFHPLTSRNSEKHAIFDTILHILSIKKIGAEFGAKKIILCGASDGVSKILSNFFSVRRIAPERTRNSWLLILRCLGSRVKLGSLFIYQYFSLKRNYKLPKRKYDLVFSGFWDWSFWWNNMRKKYTDRYFGHLPQELSDRQIKNIGYLAWLESNYEPGKRKRSLNNVLKPLIGRDDVVILQALLSPLEVISKLINFRFFFIFLKGFYSKKLRCAFIREKVDWMPIFKNHLFSGFLGSSIPFHSLVLKATEKAAERYKPKLTLSFLEHFLFSRAHYAGIKQYERDTRCWAIQHCSWNHEKTLYFLHPQKEFLGKPDGCKVPRPDQIFVMGKLGFQLFKECGYSNDQIKLTGSTRYDYINRSIFHSIPKNEKSHKQISLLLINTLNDKVEIEMLEAACLSIKGLNNFHIRLRNHPFSKLDKHWRFKRWQNDIEISKFPLEEDLSWSDLIIFSYTTVAEEAYIKGKPVWQWLPLGFNGSALSEVIEIPTFSTVAALRRALKDFIVNQDSYIPPEKKIGAAIEQLFYPADGKATKRIANFCAEYFQRKQPCSE